MAMKRDADGGSLPQGPPLAAGAGGLRRAAARAALLLMLAEIALVSWLGSGTRPEFLLPMLWVAAAMFFAAACSAPKGGVPAYVKVSFWCGAFIMLLNAVQIFNPSLEYVVHERYADLRPLAYVSWLPISVRAGFFAGDALRSLAAIAAAFSVFMSAAFIFRHVRAAVLCLAFFALNATAMAAWGIYQLKAGFPVMYDVFFSISDFYGSFFLSNAAGAFINLGLAANLAMVFISSRLPGLWVRIAASAFFLASSALCVFSCYCSGSKGALGLSAALCAVFAGIWAYLLLQALFSARVASASMVLVGIVVCAAAYFAYGAAVSQNPDLKRKIAMSAESRMEIYNAAFETIEENPVCGIGGDCARYYLPQKMKQRDRKNALFVSAERAHSGPLEYLMEFGIAGASAIAIAGFAWLIRFLRKMCGLGPENFIIMAGIILFLFHSCFDLHLHIPSTMMAGAIMAVLAVSPLKRRAG